MENVILVQYKPSPQRRHHERPPRDDGKRKKTEIALRQFPFHEFSISPR